jgi:hypothetical protein
MDADVMASASVLQTMPKAIAPLKQIVLKGVNMIACKQKETNWLDCN